MKNRPENHSGLPGLINLVSSFFLLGPFKPEHREHNQQRRGNHINGDRQRHSDLCPDFRDKIQIRDKTQAQQDNQNQDDRFGFFHRKSFSVTAGRPNGFLSGRPLFLLCAFNG